MKELNAIGFYIPQDIVASEKKIKMNLIYKKTGYQSKVVV